MPHARYPRARFFGIDVSTEMLTSAMSAIARADLAGRIKPRTRRCNRGQTRRVLFAIPGFDEVMISYSLSMIPDWHHVLKGAVRLASGLAVVCMWSISAIWNSCPQ